MKTIMFHRFKNKNNISTGQGSFSSQKLKNYIEQIGENKFFKDKEINNLLNKSIVPSGKILLTFDDGLFSQYESAKPILDKYGIKSIWFIYTKIFNNNFDENEILNFVMCNYFESFDSFYLIFESFVKDIEINWESNDFRKYSAELDRNFSFYTLLDKKFRFLRNKILNKKEFMNIVIKIIESKNQSFDNIAKKLWLTKSNLRELIRCGHKVGLHSHTHPYIMKNLSFEKQLEEYSTNYNQLYEITNEEPKAVAYPLGSYDFNSIKVMKRLDIKLGFRSSSSIIKGENNNRENLLLLPRLDSALIN